jgi:hypothetical protein
MGNSPETPGEARPRLSKEYEDPHFHDDDEVAPVEDGEPRASRPAAGKRKSNRPPPPRGRFHED